MVMYVIVLADEFGNNGVYEKMYHYKKDAQEEIENLKKENVNNYEFKVKRIFIKF